LTAQSLIPSSLVQAAPSGKTRVVAGDATVVFPGTLFSGKIPYESHADTASFRQTAGAIDTVGGHWRAIWLVGETHVTRREAGRFHLPYHDAVFAVRGVIPLALSLSPIMIAGRRAWLLLVVIPWEPARR
jgi:hypothetical protein